MPAILLRFLPHIAIVLAVLGGVAWIDHKGYQRAKKDAEFERMVQAHQIQIAVNRINTKTADTIALADLNATSTVREVQTFNRTVVQPTLIREIQNAPQLADPDRGITDGLLKLINSALDLGPDTATASGSVSIALPESGPAPDEGRGGSGGEVD